MWSRCSLQASRPATLSSWIILPPTKLRASARRSTGPARAFLYLPPYSPDLNPIEQAFAKMKALLRRASERTRDALWSAVGRVLDLYTPQECRKLFKNAGYSN